MAVVFSCVLVCDVCHRSQSARAKLKALTMTSLLEPGASAPFSIEFDESDGRSWSIFEGAAVCSPACKAHLFGAT